MTETGWPLIPREVLPAPVPAARRQPPPRPAAPSDPSRQLPFFGAETTEPSPADLAGLLAGPGRLDRMGGTARVSVPVAAAWRVHVLVAELVMRGLVVNWRPLAPVRPEQRGTDPSLTAEAPMSLTAEAQTGRTAEAQTGRTAEAQIEQPPPEESEIFYDPEAEEGDIAVIGAPRADTGTDRTKRKTPSKSEISGGVVDDPEAPTRGDDDGGEGSDEGDTQSDGSPAPDEPATPAGPRFEVLTAYSRRLNGLASSWPDAAAQLFLSGPRLRLWVSAAGEPLTGGYALGLGPGKDVEAIDAALVRAGLAGRVSNDGHRYLIMGRRRLRRLAELVGDRPPAAPEELWPGSAGA
jgi:hypothetical protein